ncbi:hypothetical protein G7046_g9473 [Stylonectria norvegica]|nr:hypothetical protein G7046_g9473 [Stylonectria norvegica]
MGSGGGGGGEGGTGTGTDMLRAKLAALEQEAKILGLDPNADDAAGSSYSSQRGGYRVRGGGGGYRGRGNAPRARGGSSFRGRGGMHAAYAQYSIDNRPKKLAVTGVDFTAANKDEVLRHFLLNLGEFESVDTSPAVTHVSFQDRKTAERFYYSLNGKELPGVDGRLDLAWVNAPLPRVGEKPPAPSAATTKDRDRDEAMAGVEDAQREESASVEPQVKRQARAVDMDYEVADEDAWGD